MSPELKGYLNSSQIPEEKLGQKSIPISCLKELNQYLLN